MAKARGCDPSLLSPNKGIKKDKERDSRSDFEEKKFDERSDRDTSNASFTDNESISESTGRDNITPYAYFFKFWDNIKKIEDDRIIPDDILKAWKLSFDADNNNEEKDIKYLKYTFESMFA